VINYKTITIYLQYQKSFLVENLNFFNGLTLVGIIKKWEKLDMMGIRK